MLHSLVWSVGLYYIAILQLRRDLGASRFKEIIEMIHYRAFMQSLVQMIVAWIVRL